MSGRKYCATCDGFGCEVCHDTGFVSGTAELLDAVSYMLIVLFLAGVPMAILLKATAQ